MANRHPQHAWFAVFFMLVLGLYAAAGARPAETAPEMPVKRHPVRFGLNSFLGNLRHSELRGPTTKASADDRTRYLDAVAELGVRSIRETFANWAEIEPVQGGGYQFDAFDDIARKAADRGIEIIALSYPFPPWATGAPTTQAGGWAVPLWQLPQRRHEAAFRRFVAATVSRYCGGKDSINLASPIRNWIFSNELDQYGVTPNEYAYWLRAFCEEVKKADPGARVYAMGLTDAGGFLRHVRKNFLAEMLDSQELNGPGFPYFDGVLFHVYPFNAVPGLGHMNVAYDNIRRALARHTIRPEIWMSETGAADPNPVVQADRAVRCLVHAASLGVDRVHLHGLWDFPPPEYWGVLANSPSGQVPARKPSFRAMQTLLRNIGANQGVEFLGPGQYRVFLPGEKSLYVLWKDAKAKTPVSLPGRIRVTNLKNEVREIDAADFALDEHPVFVEATAATTRPASGPK